MPNMEWSKLSSMQLGRYAEYYAKMEFASYGFDVYTSEVDDHGVDFVARNPINNIYYEVQVKALRNTGYVFMKKKDMLITDNRLICLLLFTNDNLPAVYVIPATAWQAPEKPLVSHDYDEPEWGINLSNRNIPLLEKYRVANYFHKALSNM